jgi:MFS family permease
MSALASSRRWSALAHRDFRVYWVGQAISLVGTWMQQVAQGWAVSSLTTRNGTLALVSLVASIPMVGLSLAGGAAADRHSRRDILIVTQVLLAAVAFAYGALVWTGHLTMVGVFCLALVTGVVIAYDLPAQSALTPELVPAQDIPSAIALNQSIFHGARLIGPFLAGLVMSATSTAFAFFANGASYFAVVASLLWIRPPVRRLGAAPSGLAAIRDGIDYVRRHPVLLPLMGFTALVCAFVFPFAVVFPPLFVRTALGADEAGLGAFMAAGGLGALTGAFVLVAIPAEHRGRTLVLTSVGISAALAGLSFAHGLAQAVPLVALLSFGTSTGLGLAGTLIQIIVPNELRGRVMSIQGLMFTGLMPLAGFAAGLVADHTSLRLVMRGGAALFVVTALPWLVREGWWRLHDLTALAADAADAPDSPSSQRSLLHERNA